MPPYAQGQPPYPPPFVQGPLPQPSYAAVPRPRVPSKPPIVRGQSPENAVARLEMPEPEQLGIHIGKRPAAELDWNQLRRELDRLHARRFQLEKQDGGFRFTFELADRVMEGIGETEAEAVRIGLAKVR